jgi:hypothetical protein
LRFDEVDLGDSSMKTTRVEFLKGSLAAALTVMAAPSTGAVSDDHPATKGSKKLKNYTMLVQTNAKPGREAEFNDWYSNHHLHDVLKIPGFVAAQRFQWANSEGAKPPKYKYYAAYQMKTDDVAGTLAELFKRSGTPDLPVSDAMDSDVSFAVYEAMAPALTK